MTGLTNIVGLTRLSGITIQTGLVYGSGLGLTNQGDSPAPVATTYDFSSGLPSGWTYTRNDTTATYRDSSGNLQKATANTPRMDHDINGVALGMMKEPGLTNRMTDRNANPTTTTGWTLGGDAAAVFSVVSDPSSLLSAATCKLQAVCNTGKIYKLDNSLGVTNATATSAAQMTVTTKTTLSVWIAPTTGTATLTRTGGGTPETLVVSNNAALTRKALIVTPNATTDLFQIIAPAGAIIYFILAQIEPAYACVDASGNAVPTSEIVTTGSAAARAAEIISMASPSATGAVVAVMQIAGYGVSNNQFAFATIGAANADYQGPRLGVITAGSGNGFFGGASFHNSTGAGAIPPWLCPPLNTRFPIGFAYSPTQTTMCAGSMKPQVTTLTSTVAAPTSLGLGSRATTGSESIKAWFTSVTVFNYYATPLQMGPYMFNSSDFGIAMAGQSNAQYYTLDQAPAVVNNTGEVSFVSQMNTYWNTGRNWLVQGATGGSALLQVNQTGTGWWYDPSDGSFGAAYTAWQNAVQTFQGGGKAITCIIWDQGENDAQYVSAAGTVGGLAIYTAALLTVFNKMLTICPGAKIGIVPIGRRQGSATPSNGYEVIREAQYAFAAANSSFCFMCPEKYDLALEGTGGNNVHLAPASYATQAIRIVNKARNVLNGGVSNVDCPTISSASRATAVLTINCSENLSPASAAQGLSFYDDASQILFTTVTVTGSTITATLASTPSGTVKSLYMGYNDLPDVSDNTKILVGATSALPLSGSGTSHVVT